MLPELFNRFDSGRSLRNHLHVQFSIDQPCDPVAGRGRPQSGFESARNHSYNIRFLSKESESPSILRLRVCPCSRNRQFNFGPCPGFTPDIESPSNPFRALANSRQAPVPGRRAFLQYVPVDAFSIVANPQAKVASEHFGFLGCSKRGRADQRAGPWINMDNNVKSHNQNAVPPPPGSLVATASGTITGLDKDCVNLIVGRACNCRGGGHGTLQIFGT
jgi:hypothetical protein